MTIRAKSKLTLISGVLAAVAALGAPLAANAADSNAGAWEQFHNSHVSAGGAAASASFPGGYAAFHKSQTDAQAGSDLHPAEHSLQGAWDGFHNGHVVAKS
jgi:hypothetical protein